MKLNSVFFSENVFGFCFSGLLLTITSPFFFICYIKKESFSSGTEVRINKCLYPEDNTKTECDQTGCAGQVGNWYFSQNRFDCSVLVRKSTWIELISYFWECA